MQSVQTTHQPSVRTTALKYEQKIHNDIILNPNARNKYKDKSPVIASRR